MTETPTVTCYLITHDGEGEPGESVEIVGTVPSVEYAAEQAARYFHDREKQYPLHRFGLTDSDFDGASDVIEVRGFRNEPLQRFRVRCHVVRHYRAVEEPGRP